MALEGRTSMPLSIDRRRALALLSSFVATPWLVPRISRAAEVWPIRSVKYVNGFPAGGATDTLSRVLCQKLSELSGQSFVVENKAGAGGVLGADAIAKAPPDGYTVGLGGIANNVLAIGSYAKLPYHPREDFTFISGMWQLPNILTAKKGLFSADLKELLAAFKKEPGKYTYASAGFGTTLHLSGEMMNSMAGVQVRHVPYRGGAIRPVAVTAKTRLAELPDVPAMAELLPGYELTSWAGLIGPTHMPADLVAQINALTVRALKDPWVKQRYADLGATTWPTTPQEISAYRDSEEVRLLPIMKAAGIKPEGGG
jgi:tripartite-type tricarboxylate transporter receptor subunit TctC